MRTIVKRSVSIILAVLMIMTLPVVSGINFKVSAATNVGDWNALKKAVKNASKGSVVELTADIYTDKLSERVVADGKRVTVDLKGHSIKKSQSNKYEKNGHVFEIQGHSDFKLIDSVGGGTVEGGCGKNGGAINVHDGSTCTVENVTFKNNRAGIDGGAILNRGHLIMKNCVITNNTAEDTGAGIFNAGDGWFDLDGVEISYNTAKNEGGGLKIHLDKDCTMNNCNIHHNVSSTDHGGGFALVDDSAKLKLYNTAVSDNKCNDYGGGIYNSEGYLYLYGCTISNNTAKYGGGGIYNDDYVYIKDEGYGTTVIEGNTADIGGGIYHDKDHFYLNNCEIRNNTAHTSGGGVHLDDGFFHMDGGKIYNNEALYQDGGGVDIYNGSFYMYGGEITHNTAMRYGGGVFCDPEMDDFGVQGTPKLINNNCPRGKDLYITSHDTVDIDGKLGNGAMISFTLVNGNNKTNDYGEEIKEQDFVDRDDYDALTDGYSKYHGSEDPASYFISAEGYELELRSGEVWPGNNKTEYIPSESQTIDKNTFLSWKDVVETDTDNLNGANWLAGVSGERTLNEINVPVTHDSSMRAVSSATKCIGSSMGGYEDAVTQIEYIYEQLESGIRGLDLRLSNKRVWGKEHDTGSQKDDGENLFMCHGKSSSGGTYYAADPVTGYPLNFLTVLDWVETFLTSHPTEFVFIDFSAECQHGYDEDIVYRRLDKILREHINDINPATGEPFFYLEDGVYGKEYSAWPKLKDVRGKIVIKSEEASEHGVEIGGMKTETINGKYFRPEQEGDYTLSAEDRIDDVKDFAKKQIGTRNIPTDASRIIDQSTGKPIFIKTGTNCTDAGLFDIPGDHPYLLAKIVNEELFGYGKVFSTERKGKFLGWVSSDATNGFTCANVYKTNYSNDYQYKTITVLSNKEEIPTQTFKILKGSEITIPGYVYDFDQKAGNSYFNGWKSGDKLYKEGEKCVINNDITFQALWNESGVEQSRVTVKWEDANNKDELRENTVSIRVNNQIDFEIEAANNWSIPLPVLVDSISVTWDNAMDNADTDHSYRYVVDGDNESGWIITLIHTPTDSVDITMSVYFRDMGWGNNKPRPDSLTYGLYVKGTDEMMQQLSFPTNENSDEIKVEKTFEAVPKYYNGAEIQHEIKLVETTGNYADLTKYDVVTEGVDVFYTLKGLTELDVKIYWDEIDESERPESLIMSLIDVNTNTRSDYEIHPTEDTILSICSYNIIADGFDDNSEPIIDYSRYNMVANDAPSRLYFNTFNVEEGIYVVVSRTEYASEVSMVEAMIDEIGEVTESSEAKITRARLFYNLISEESKEQVSNYRTLQMAERKFAQIADADIANTISLIKAIKTVKYDEETKNKLDEARTAYNNLSSEQKYYIVEYLTLLAFAETQYAVIERREVSLQKEVDRVIDAINDIGEVTDGEPETFSRIDEARVLYNLLDEEGKTRVVNYDVLVNAEAEFWGRYFLASTDFTTDGADHSEEIETLWTELSASWDELDQSVKAVLANDETNETAILFRIRYFEILNEYEDLSEFTDGPVTHFYTVTWKNYNGDVLEIDENVNEGAVPSYDGETPTKPDDDVNTYEFAGWDPAVSVVTGNSTYTAQFTEVQKSLSVLVGHSISLDGDIGVNFYTLLSDDIANSDTAYMHFTIPTGSGTTTQDVLVKDARQVTSGDKTYYVFKCQVAAKEMTSVIKAQIIDGENVGEEYTYSVKEYADYLLEHAEEREDWSNAVPIVKAMLNYGAYSQIYFDKNPTALANAGLTDREKALADVNISQADPIINLPDGVTFEGATLSLKSETTLSLYFTADSQPEFSCGDYTVEPVQNGRYYVARIRGIAAKHIGDTFTLNVGSGSITYSPLNYIANALNGGTEDENLINSVKALYWYWQAADAYFPE